jgi:hypothetical protein
MDYILRKLEKIELLRESDDNKNNNNNKRNLIKVYKLKFKL